MKITRDEKSDIAVLQAQVEMIFKSLEDLKVMLEKQSSTYATKIDLINAITELRSEFGRDLADRRHKVDTQITRLESTLTSINDDFQNREADRKRLIWIILGTAVPSIFTLILNILSKLGFISL